MENVRAGFDNGFFLRKNREGESAGDGRSRSSAQGRGTKFSKDKDGGDGFECKFHTLNLKFAQFDEVNFAYLQLSVVYM